MKKIKLTVNGMFCAHCSNTVEETLTSLGVVASVDLTSNKVFIKYDETKISLERMQRVLKKAGYSLVIDKKESHWPLIEMILGIILTLPLFWTMFGHLGLHSIVPNFFNNWIFQIVLATLVQIIVGAGFYYRAFFQIKNKNLGMDVLVSLATTAAYILSIYGIISNGPLYFEASAMVLCVVNIGHHIADSVKSKTGQALKELTKLQVKEAEIVTKKGPKLIPIEEVEIGDLVNVKIGEKIPLDGVIVSGSSSLDEALISGESIAVNKTVDDVVYGGSINLDSPLVIRITHDIDNSLLSQIIEQVNLSSFNKPKLQKVSDKVANFFVPSVILLAIIAFIINFFLLKNSFDISLIRAVSVLVVSCPCALGLAVPLSVLVGYSLAAKKGVLFQSGDSFETLKTINAVAFDKTGTLSSGKLKISAMLGDESYLPLVRFLESSSTHPIATSLCSEIKEAVNYPDITITEVRGLGIKGIDQDSNQYLLGSRQILKDVEITDTQEAFLLDHKQSSLIFLVKNKDLLLIIALEDAIKESSISAVSKLFSKSIITYMISGDKKEVALSVADVLGIPSDYVYAEVKPLEKADIIKRIQQEGYKVAFVGDGINDALALQTSDLGMAIRDGSDIAINAADVVLLTPDLDAVYTTIRISEIIYRNIIENFIWALCYNLVMIPLAITGVVSPVISGICMALSNILVVLNALRLYLRKELR